MFEADNIKFIIIHDGEVDYDLRAQVIVIVFFIRRYIRWLEYGSVLHILFN